MKRLLALLAVSMMAAPVAAQGPWYAKGTFQTNQWSTDNPMTDLGGGHWTTTVTGLFDNQNFEYKLATADWSASSPGGNGVVTTNAAGEITFHMWDQTTWTDGWFPNNARRVGYNDPLQYGWQVMGSFNGWSTGLNMTTSGSGLYSYEGPFNAGFYDFKFRKAEDWGINMGYDFTNAPSGNNSFAVATTGDVWHFDLDLPNGRWRAFSVDQHGDFNGDGNTDAADYVWWKKNNAGNAAKYTEWRSNFGRSNTLSWIAHGDFGNDVTLTNAGAVTGGTLYTTTLSGLTPGQGYDVQVFRSDASSHWPGSAAKIAADASGNINLKFYELTAANWGDGYQPDTWSRVGYTDPEQFGWEVIGSFNGWPGTNDPLYNLTAQGNGVYTGSFAMPTAGSYEYKFRKQGDWGISIGNDFGNSAGNNTFTVAADGEIWNFELDLPHGKFRAYHPTGGLGSGAVPEPASAALAMLGLAVFCLTSRRPRG